MQPKQVDLLRQYQNVCQQNHHRGLVLVAGDEAWTQSTAEEIQQTLKLNHPVVVNSAIEAKKLLGSETNHVIFNSFSGLNLNALAISAGSIVGGGLLILRCPELHHWPEFEDPEYLRLLAHPYTAQDVSGRFLRRFSQQLLTNPNVLIISQTEQAGEFLLPVQYEAEDSKDISIATQDQAQVVNEIIELGQSDAGILLVTADRGRGKSAMLGLAATQLAALGVENILVTGPSPKATSTVFKHLQNATNLLFKSPDDLILHQPDASLVMIDEAAAIPLPVLEEILCHYPRVVMTTTVHGYEGTGRAILLRFGRTLDRINPDWVKRELYAPIRFATHDPLEQIIHDSLILNAEPTTLATSDASNSIRKVDRDHLADNEGQLRQVFGLLMLAHYKTRPDDLRHLLDAPNLDVFVIEQQHQVVATAMVSREGELEPELIAEIAAGRRRPRGHLLPQTLVYQCQLMEAGAMRCARVIRIAVLPQLQQQGLGRELLEYIENEYQKNKIELIGTSFGLEPGLLKFWEKSGYDCVRIGHKRHAASGFHSGLLIKSLAGHSTSLVKQAKQQFSDQPELSVDPDDQRLPISDK